MNWISIVGAILGFLATVMLYRGSRVLSMSEIMDDMTFKHGSAKERANLAGLQKYNRWGLRLLAMSFMLQLLSGLGFGAISV